MLFSSFSFQILIIFVEVVFLKSQVSSCVLVVYFVDFFVCLIYLNVITIISCFYIESKNCCMFTILKRTWKSSSRTHTWILNLKKTQTSTQVVQFATIPSSFRIGSHINNLEDPSIPFVLIETSFLSKCSITQFYVNCS